MVLQPHSENALLYAAGRDLSIQSIEIVGSVERRSADCRLEIYQTENALYGTPGNPGGPAKSPWDGSWVHVATPRGRMSSISFDAFGQVKMGAVFVPYQHPTKRDKHEGGNWIAIAPKSESYLTENHRRGYRTTFPEEFAVYSGSLTWQTCHVETTLELTLNPDATKLDAIVSVTPSAVSGCAPDLEKYRPETFTMTFDKAQQ